LKCPSSEQDCSFHEALSGRKDVSAVDQTGRSWVVSINVSSRR
jgi:hypothetical protein